MKDPTSQLRAATRRAKSDVANKLVSMFLHELSRSISQGWPIKVDDEEYEKLRPRTVQQPVPILLLRFDGHVCVIEHLDGMNRSRAGLHVAGNVLVACRRCNNEKRRDDSLRSLLLAESGWESFLSHDSSRCAASCLTCVYWKGIWPDETERQLRLGQNLQRIRVFRGAFLEFQQILPSIMQTLPALLTKLYSDCQTFAETEIRSLLEGLGSMSGPQV